MDSFIPGETDVGAGDGSAWAERSKRLTTMLMAGRLVTPAADHLCRVRNVSEGGMMVECDADLALGDPVRIELRNLSVVEAKIVWVRHPRAGVQFTAPADVQAIIHGAAEAGKQPRAPRLTADCALVIAHAGRTSGATLRDLSQSGCRIGTREVLPVGSEIRVDLPGLTPHHGTVKWVRDGEIGVAFRALLSFAELSAWQRNYDRRFDASRA